MAAAPLDLIFPRPVLVTLAGEPYKVSELTLGDLATLQSWLRQAAGDPLRDLPPAPLDPEPATRRNRLLDAWRRAKAWPPLVGSDDDVIWLDSPEGRAVFLVLCLGKHDPTMDAEKASGLAAALTAAEWAAVRRVAWGYPPWRELAAELDPEWLAEQRQGSAEADWGESVARVMRLGGYTFEQVERWTPTQLRLYASEGRLGEYRTRPKPGESREEFEARMVATFTPDPAPAGDSPPG